MKTLIIIAVCMLVAGTVYADKADTYNSVSNINMSIGFNPSEMVGEGEEAVLTYYPAQVTCKGVGRTDLGGVRHVSASNYVGVGTDTPYTNLDIYGLLPAVLREAYRDMILDAINVDVSE